MNIAPIIALSDGIRALAAQAMVEGHQNIQTLVDEFETEINCFDKPGEGLFGAYRGNSIVGIGGVSVDPYDRLDVVARVRRVFVLPTARREGVATALMQQIEEMARRHFPKIQLFTASTTASRFYVNLGYSQVHHRAKVSHEKLLGR